MPDITNQFIGPIGGLLCIAFAMGGAAGWGFAVKLLSARITDLKADILRERMECHTALADHANRIRELEDRAYHGQERQLAQVRQSTVTVIDRMGGTP